MFDRFSALTRPLAALGVLLLLPSPALSSADAVPQTLDCRYAVDAADATPADGVPVRRVRRFPRDDLFRPVLADPKQPQFVISRQRVIPEQDGDFVAGWVVYGETFGIRRYVGDRPCDGVQVNIQGGVFAQFNLSAPSYDLLNSDYVVGLPVTFRRGDVSARFRLYHQSSHLGDEFLLGSPGVTRVNLSFEDAELLLSYEWRSLRVYGGAARLIHREPALENLRWQYGGEFRLPLSRLPRQARMPSFDYFVAGVDFKQFQQHGYAVDSSLKVGYELESDLSDRRFRLLFDFYNGFNPFGQFYDHHIKAIGVEVNFGF